MRFVDDVEFVYDDKAGLIHVRSASRLGRRDFGVNRARVEALRARIEGRLRPEFDDHRLVVGGLRFQSRRVTAAMRGARSGVTNTKSQQ